jgi:hypothetical protein
MKFYRQKARRILAGQKKLSTILITGWGVALNPFSRKMLIDGEPARARGRTRRSASCIVEKLRMEVDNGGVETGLGFSERAKGQNLSGHFLYVWKTRSISTTSLRTRYGTIYGAPEITNSRVPGTLPGRPMEGCCQSPSAEWVILITIRPAAPGLSRAIVGLGIPIGQSFAKPLNAHCASIS